MSKIIINIGRQLGSGGREVARRLAETFGCKFYDKELLNLAARESGFSEKFFEQNDEHKGFLRTLFHVHVPHLSDNSFYSNKATNVFITASMEWRIAQVSKRHQCDEQTARKIIHNAESQRASYYNYYTGKRWGDAASYDLCIDTSILGIDDTHQLIADFIRKRLDKGCKRQ